MRLGFCLKQLVVVVLGLSLLSSVGCGSSEPVAVESQLPPELQSVDEMKERLQTIEKQGFAGSGLHGLKPGLLALNNREVARQFEQLEKADSYGYEAGVRQSAQRILRLL